MAGSDVAAWPKKISTITLFAEDLGATKAFYQEVFGLPVYFEDADSVVFNFGNMLVNLLASSAVPELIEPASIASPDSGARFQLTVDVDDVDAVCAELAKRGIELLNGPIDRPWGVRTAAFRDPAGHVWEIAK
jgi:catechol 2,3-dioxygenase-like lactoylglutathione lyase family enzyme